MAKKVDNPVPAYEVFLLQFRNLFNVEKESFWLKQLYTASKTYYKQGATSNDLPDLLLTDTTDKTKAYRDRFTGIELLRQRKDSGDTSVEYIPNVAQYASMEKSMRQTLQSYGLNKLATRENLGKIIGNDVDAKEFNDRITTAFDAIDAAQADPYMSQALKQTFGDIPRADLANALLMGKAGAKEIARKVNVSGVQAAISEVGVTNQTDINTLEAMGVTRESARKGYMKTKSEMSGLESAQKQFGGTANLAKELEDTNVLDKPSDEIKRLRSQTRGQYTGTTGVAQGSLSRKRTGQL